MKYIANIYGPAGLFIEVSIANERFTLVACGNAWFDEDEGCTGEYAVEKSLELTRNATLTESFLSIFELSEQQGVLRDSRAPWDGFDQIAYDTFESNSFSPSYFLIFDRNMLVASIVRERGIWQFQELLTGEAAKDAFRRADKLYSEARIESGWDNYSTARSLRTEARLLCYQTENNITIRSKGFINEMRSLMSVQQTKIEIRAQEIILAHAQLLRS